MLPPACFTEETTAEKNKKIIELSQSILSQEIDDEIVRLVKGDYMFIAKLSESVRQENQKLWVLEMLKQISESIEESFGYEKIKENTHSLSSALLTLLDNGLPLGSKPLF